MKNICGVDHYDFAEFGGDPHNNPDLVEENAESALHTDTYLLSSLVSLRSICFLSC